jgi:hypothetical protein
MGQQQIRPNHPEEQATSGKWRDADIQKLLQEQ